MQQKTLVAIAGPTGVGKTALCLSLASRWKCDVVNCDSRQIYRDLPVGTAAPTEEERKRVKHWFVATHGLDEVYNAGEYERDATALLERLAAGHTEDSPFAVLSGGSMMYMDAVCKGLDDIPHVPEALREEIKRELAERGMEWLQAEVEQADPDYWRIVDRQNPQRLIHCLEVTRHTGTPYSSFRRRRQAERPWRTVKIGLSCPREELYERINRRVDKMMADGLEAEARRALDQAAGGGTLPNSLRTVGYNELVRYFRGEWTLEEAVAMIKQNTRRYAKRQMTWLRADKDLIWLDARLPEEQLIDEIEEKTRQ
jgi:tRNA dimethylallyltransferase